jgi:tetratricopeptide (TPR) repeat protein
MASSFPAIPINRPALTSSLSAKKRDEAHLQSSQAIRHMKTMKQNSRFNPRCQRTTLLALLTVVTLLRPAACSADGASLVKVTEQTIIIPTYLAGEPEPNPMFYFGRNSQGAEGRVYPYPLYDTLTNVKSNKTYRIVYLENEYVRIGILPEIGGRVIEAVDKSNGYNFVYRQHVIKPALIGLIGAWMSGGVEWNIPHHHRASTFLPVQYRIEKNADGSKTVWVGELEVRQRMRWAVGYTLSPGKSYLTARVRIVNRTPFVNTMLCFANLAVHANDRYQIIFPPDTQFVTFHAKREFVTWPIAKGPYSGSDFGSGTDVSWYSNHANANSMFAWNYTDDFFAGYDHGKEAGTMSVADHHIVPGKKFWTWGSGPRGRMWDKILTDNDGPYIELMVGAYSDNQPDYSWLQPFETKSFEMHWYPFRDIGGVKNANLDAAVNLDVTNGTARVGFCSTSNHRLATVALKAGDKVLFEEKIAINPGKPFVKQISIPSGLDEHDLRASLAADGRELVAYSPVRLQPATMPESVTNMPAATNILTVEELYLAGQRIEQFHDPAREPEPYWEEALRRDPGDARVNTALGIRQLKQAKFTEAEQHFRKALERLTVNYTSPKDGEPFYYLGVALKAQEKFDDAFDAFYKAIWSEAWRGPAYFSLAEIATQRGDYSAALDYLDRSLNANALNIRALTLKAAVLRHLGRTKESVAALDVAAREVDPLDVHLMAERWLAGDKKAANELTATLRDYPANGLETATEFGNAGLWEDGVAVLTLMADATRDKFQVSPLAYYYLGQFAEQFGDPKKAAEYRRLATRMSPEYCFPFQWEAIHVLCRAMELDPQDARAPYYLGNLLFDWQPEEAMKLWAQSAALDPRQPMVHRNLAVAYSHQEPTNDVAEAIAQLELAVSADRKYAMHFTELDELYARAGKPPEQRLALLEQNHDVVLKRDDALSREIGLKVFAGKYDEAIQLMTGRKFSVWEGGTLDVADHWVDAHLLRGQQELAARKFTAALADFQAAKNIPDNLPSDRGVGRGRNVECDYWIGNACEAMGALEKAKQSWQEASSTRADRPRRRGTVEGGPQLDRSVQRYYQALAQRKLGQGTEADATLHGLVDTANRALEREAAREDASTPIGERQSSSARTALAHYTAGLGHLGLGEMENAKQEFTLALQTSPDHLGSKTALAQLQ